LEVPVEATVEFVKSTEWPSNSPDLNLLDFHSWNRFKTVSVQKAERTAGVPATKN
jgi:hypothetical protein